MKKSAEIRQAIKGLIDQQEALNLGASNEKRSLNDAEMTSFNDLQSQIEARKKELAIEETREANLRDFGGKSSESQFEKEVKEGKEEERTVPFSLNKAIRSIVNGEAFTSTA